MPELRRCPKCGTDNPDDSRECIYCGEALRPKSAPQTSRLAVASFWLAWLLIPAMLLALFLEGPLRADWLPPVVGVLWIVGVASLAIVAIIHSRREPGGRGGVPLASCALALCAFWGLLGLGGVLMISSIPRFGGQARQAVCLHNLETLVGALRTYMEDSDNILPSGDTWCEAVQLQIDKMSHSPGRIFVCPKGPQLPCSYAYNSALAGLSPEALADPEHTVVLFESDAGWNAHGGPELLPREPRHFGGDNYAFADGSATSGSRSEAHELQWRPRLRKIGGEE